ncbi:hypothetical protein [Arenimonas donghaensis]|uniref:hypothetical protein n=1 Tax=Arenimonas donghaensis TaxID=375061 RepID=UPI001267EEB3|nr:hypothetical protein [Arenimonas donghaensis]
MLTIELRHIYRPNGLIDDLVVYGLPQDYAHLSERVESAIASTDAVVVDTDSSVRVEISRNDELETLFTSLQNDENEYFSAEDWNGRNVLRVTGPEQALRDLSAYFFGVSLRSEGYRYISEYSDSGKYSEQSPEWRLHVEKD